jgi:hypothetical protein
LAAAAAGTRPTFKLVTGVSTGALTAPQTWDSARLPLLGSPEARPDHPNSVVTDWSVDPEEYGAFLCKVFTLLKMT